MPPATLFPPTAPTIQPATYGHDASLARFSLASYQRMIETGILTAEDHVELLENYVVLKMPRNPPHDGTIQLLLETLLPHRLAGWQLRVQQTIVLADSQPEPDFAIVRGTARSYLTRHPGSADTALLIEVADSSLLRDRADKARIYARADIPVYWIVNLVDGRVEVYTQPSGPHATPGYGASRFFHVGDAVPLVVDGTVTGTVPVADLLP